MCIENVLNNLRGRRGHRRKNIEIIKSIDKNRNFLIKKEISALKAFPEQTF
jgi:hypothetical protein